MKRSLTAILLLFVLIGPVTLTYVWLEHQKYVLKKEIKNSLLKEFDKKDLVKLQFTHQETKILFWEEEHEFELEGQMYDVVYRDQSADSVTFWCWKDDKETLLNEKLETLLENAWQQNNQKQDTQIKLISYFQILFCDSFFQWTPLSNKCKMKFPDHASALIFICLSPEIPPPIH